MIYVSGVFRLQRVENRSIHAPPLVMAGAGVVYRNGQLLVTGDYTSVGFAGMLDTAYAENTEEFCAGWFATVIEAANGFYKPEVRIRTAYMLVERQFGERFVLMYLDGEVTRAQFAPWD